MQHYRIVPGEFKVLGQFQGGQVAAMTLAPGDTSGEHANEHPSSVQVLFVVSGTGSARIEDQEIPLNPGDLLVIEREEKHQIRAATELRTLNLYIPPGYDAEGEPLEG